MFVIKTDIKNLAYLSWKRFDFKDLLFLKFKCLKYIYKKHHFILKGRVVNTYSGVSYSVELSWKIKKQVDLGSISCFCKH